VVSGFWIEVSAPQHHTLRAQLNMMSAKIVRMTALFLAVAALVIWFSTGANRGWTKTCVPKKTVDEVTGIVGEVYEQCFVPGVDFLGAAALVCAVLFGASFLFRKKQT
jgi:hypothetical protein